MLFLKSIRTVFLSALISSTLIIFPAQATAGISFGYHGGHGFKVGFGHYGHRYGHRKYFGHRYYGHRGYYKRRYYSPSYRYYRPYRHSYRSYNYYPNRTYKRDRVVNSYPVQKKSHDYAVNTNSYNYHSNQNAWTTLIDGQAKNALSIFSSQSQSHPQAGLPKAGFALAAATSGDLDRGVWAMRRAFQYDPNSLHQLTKDSRLYATFDDLIARYEYPLQHEGRHQDEAFMVAALQYLKGDYTAARQAAELAQKDGDNSNSFKNLQHLLAAN